MTLVLFTGIIWICNCTKRFSLYFCTYSISTLVLPLIFYSLTDEMCYGTIVINAHLLFVFPLVYETQILMGLLWLRVRMLYAPNQSLAQ